MEVVAVLGDAQGMGYSGNGMLRIDFWSRGSDARVGSRWGADVLWFPGPVSSWDPVGRTVGRAFAS